MRNCGLHPLIHTRLKFTLAQDIVYCQLPAMEKVRIFMDNSEENTLWLELTSLFIEIGILICCILML